MATETPSVAPRRAEVPMVDAEVVRQIRELNRGGWGAKRISRELELARITVLRYVRPRAGGAGIQIAHFPSVKTLEDFDFKFQPSIDAKLVRELATGRFIASAENALFFGPPGVGKTHLAIALGRAVVEAGHTVLFTTATALLADLVDGQSKGILASRMFFYGKPKLLVVDELGYMPLERQSAHLFFQLVSHRYEKASMLITTNQSVTQWGQVFGDDVIAAAILDRLLHHSHTFMVQGESYRLRQKRKAGLRLHSAPPLES